MKILIMGLPGSGKTTLAKELRKKIKGVSLNGDKVRKKFNDWDFSVKGRIRQAKRMTKLSAIKEKRYKYVIIDFVCPTNFTRKLFNADFIIWMDTIKLSRFDDTNKLFQRPRKYNFRIKKFSKDNRKNDLEKIFRLIKKS